MYSTACCDAAQMELALERIVTRIRHLIYELQEGRDVACSTNCEPRNCDQARTVEANERLGFKADLRNHQTAAFCHFQADRVRLLSNNPEGRSRREGWDK
jgi:GTP cyclohydrolase II